MRKKTLSFPGRILFLLLAWLAGSRPLLAATVDTVSTWSDSMKKNIPAMVIRPDTYGKNNTRFPAVYLLHGYGGSYAAWLSAIPELREYADNYQVLLVCADGNIGSWYFDSPVDPAWKYETYVGTELVKWIDTNYRTIASKKGRGITGYSMGGHGALYLAFKHPDIFGTAGSMSGGVDFRPFPKNWDIEKRLGSYQQFPARWDENTVINLVPKLEPGALALIIDCGTADFFFTVNNAFHDKLLSYGIAHDYITRPGKHDWPYWRNSIGYELLFMSRYFKSN